MLFINISLLKYIFFFKFEMNNMNFLNSFFIYLNKINQFTFIFKFKLKKYLYITLQYLKGNFNIKY